VTTSNTHFDNQAHADLTSMELTFRGAALSEEVPAPAGLEQGIWDALGAGTDLQETSGQRMWFWGAGAAVVLAGLAWLVVNPPTQVPDNTAPRESREVLPAETEGASPAMGASFERTMERSVSDAGVSVEGALNKIEAGSEGSKMSLGTPVSPGSSAAKEVTDQGSLDVAKPQPMRALGGRDAQGVELQTSGSHGLKTDQGQPQTERRPATIEVKE